MMASLASGGSADSITDGVNFFHQLKQAGNFVPVQATAATIKAGTTPVVINWDYLNTASVVGSSTWKVFVPQNAVIGGYYAQAINKQAPHPAAARLWEEFLYSQDRERRPEPVARGRRAPRRAAGDDHQQHNQHERRLSAAGGQRHAGVPHPDAGDRRLDLSRG